MQPFASSNGLVAPLDRANVDTDAIIPKQFLKSIKRTGFGANLFDAWRYLDHGEPGMDNVAASAQPGFRAQPAALPGRADPARAQELRLRQLARARALGAGRLRLSRVIAPSYADIFFNNCFKNGLLPMVLCEGEVDRLFHEVAAFPGFTLVVDLDAQTVATPDGASTLAVRRRAVPQALPAERPGRDRPHAAHADEIRAFEARRQTSSPGC